jgi:hypothetical protein
MRHEALFIPSDGVWEFESYDAGAENRFSNESHTHNTPPNPTHI